MATDRQYEILTSIVSEYVKHGQPISSQQILEAYKLDMSSATIRNEMVILEQQGYIEKAYKSAGRIPTNKGYQYYLKNVQENPESIEFLKNKLKEIFSNRNENIESTISKALGVINDATNTLSISKSETKDTKLEDLKVYQISEDKLMILLVASNGEIHNSELMLNELKFEEIETAINIFSERLKGTYLYEIEEKANALKNIVSSNVKSLEDNFQEVIKLIFKNVTASTEQHQGVNSLVRANSVTSKQLEKVLELVENKTI
jgi:heat-inducible transcriptional repressor